MSRDEILPSKEFLSEVQFSLSNLDILLGTSPLEFLCPLLRWTSDLSLHIFSIFIIVSDKAVVVWLFSTFGGY